MRIFCYMLCIFVYFIYVKLVLCEYEKVTFVSAEHPAVVYFSPKYVNNVSVNSRRVSRQDPRHYVNFFIDLRVPLDNKFKMDLHFSEFVQINRYRRTFLEFHFSICDMIDNNPVFGLPFKIHLDLLNQTCPYPAGRYTFPNMTSPFVPQWFKFTKGRLYINTTVAEDFGNIQVGMAYVDIEVKTMKIKKRL